METTYDDMGERPQIPTPDWLRRAIECGSPQLSVYLAHSEPILFDALDAVLGTEDDYCEFEVYEN